MSKECPYVDDYYEFFGPYDPYDDIEDSDDGDIISSVEALPGGWLEEE